MDYKKFYLAIRRYAKRKITRGEFLVDWGYAQSVQGVKPKRKTGSGKWVEAV